MQRLFGTDGVRGLANKEITAELALNLGRAATLYFAEKANKKPRVFIGRDTRISGHMLEAAIAAGICSAGGEAHVLGVMPTPAIAYLTRSLKADAGVVISASHNHFADNGIKFFSSDGYKLPDEVEDQIQSIMEDSAKKLPSGEMLGEILIRPGLAAEYVDYVNKVANVDARGLKVVLDCANGASYEIAPVVFRQLGAKVIEINSNPNGININDGCGSTHMESLSRAVLEHKADLGIANDGDADRCLLIDENGNEVDGDQIMFICALELMREKKLKDNVLVTTVMSNIGLHKAIELQGGRCVTTAVGDRYVLEEMLKTGYNLGGEQSGHVILSDMATTGDGIITGTQVLKAMINNNKTLSELAAMMTKYPQKLLNVKVKSKTGWEDSLAIENAIKYAENALKGDGRILVRASGTEPLIRVMAEGKDQKVLEELTSYIADIIKRELG